MLKFSVVYRVALLALVSIVKKNEIIELDILRRTCHGKLDPQNWFPLELIFQ